MKLMGGHSKGNCNSFPSLISEIKEPILPPYLLNKVQLFLKKAAQFYNMYYYQATQVFLYLIQPKIFLFLFELALIERQEIGNIIAVNMIVQYDNDFSKESTPFKESKKKLKTLPKIIFFVICFVFSPAKTSRCQSGVCVRPHTP